jgi:hypothetical protein
MGNKEPPDDSGGEFMFSTPGGMSFDNNKKLKN